MHAFPDLLQKLMTQPPGKQSSGFRMMAFPRENELEYYSVKKWPFAMSL